MWQFKREERQFDSIPVGDHRVRIASVEMTTSKSGNEMLKIVLDVSGYSAKLFHYIVFLPDNPQMTNRKLTELFDSCGISENEAGNYPAWVGRAGAVHTKEDEFGTKVAYFISEDSKRYHDLPAWKDAGNGTKLPNGMKVADMDDDSIPF